MLHPCFGDGPGLQLYFGQSQFSAQDVIVVVETAVDAVIVAMVRQIQGNEELNGEAEILDGQAV